MKKYKHKKLNIIACNEFNRCSNGYYQIENDEIIRASIIENSDDWQEVKEEYPKIISFRSLYSEENGLILTYEGEKCVKTSDENYRPHTNIISFSRALEDPKCEIYQVAKSKDEIFTIGDKINFTHSGNAKYFTIDSFKYHNNNEIRFILKETHLMEFPLYSMNNLIHYKEPLFITEDGVEIFEGNECWQVCISSNSFSSCPRKSKARKEILPIPSYFKYFSTEEVAKQYIKDNKLQFSKKQIEDAINSNARMIIISQELYVNKNEFKENLGI